VVGMKEKSALAFLTNLKRPNKRKIKTKRKVITN
jgi:hypothetical protein